MRECERESESVRERESERVRERVRELRSHFGSSRCGYSTAA